MGKLMSGCVDTWGVSRVKNISSDMTLLQVFETLDIDKSNFIEAKEFENIVQMLNISLPEDGDLMAIFKKYDLNTDGKLEFKEFKKLMNECIHFRSKQQKLAEI